MAALTSSRFSDFYRAIHGENKLPYPWQCRLASDVIDGGTWPDSINVPTGCGKTSCIDVAVYALACRPDSNPRRIVYAVNRRAVVDAGDERAAVIAHKLENPKKESILHEVGDALHSMSCGRAALKHVVLRGGTHIDRDWHNDPTQPCIVSSTVDQAGSRLLFRGYGTGRISRYVEAGLLGTDCLWLLDETHVSRSFTKTLRDVERLRGSMWSKVPPQRPWCIVEMTATPVGDSEKTFCLNTDDVDHPGIKSKITAPKPCKLFKSKAKNSGDHIALAKDMVGEATDIQVTHKLGAVAVIANRVATARIVYQTLIKEGHTAHLIIGRMRPRDRDSVMHDLDFLKTGSRSAVCDVSQSETNAIECPVFVVSTQCLEVGADLDFDGMVSEASSFDSLRQRFGRLNRAGSWRSSRGVIVAPKSVSAGNDDDPIYDDTSAKTWDFLTAGGNRCEIDFGIRSIDELAKLRGKTSDLTVPSIDSPTLLPAHMDILCQTNPHLHAEPDVAPFLHGFGRGIPHVSIAWRRGMSDADAVEMLRAIPPIAAECMQVPIWDVRAFLKDRHVVVSGGDAEWQHSAGVSGVKRADKNTMPMHTEQESQHNGDPGGVNMEQGVDTTVGDLRGKCAIFCWRGKDSITQITDPGEIRPNDVIILPVESGGWSELGHVPPPDDVASSMDIAEDVAFKERGRVRMRIGKSFAGKVSDASLSIANELVSATELEESRDTLRELKSNLRDSLTAIRKGGELFVNPEASWSIDYNIEVTRASNILVRSVRRPRTNNSDFKTRLLENHLSGVRDNVSAYADRLGLDPSLADVLVTAARLHDVGKVDARFQRLLHRSIYPRNDLLLAKHIGTGDLDAYYPKGHRAKFTSDKDAARAFLRQLGYPDGYRHEFTSSAMVSNLGTADNDLFMHVVESHHGHCRPFVPVVFDDSVGDLKVRYDYEGVVLTASPLTGLERVGSGAARRFWRCVRKYGWWGLAWLESILLLADWETSRGVE